MTMALCLALVAAAMVSLALGPKTPLLTLAAGLGLLVIAHIHSRRQQRELERAEDLAARALVGPLKSER